MRNKIISAGLFGYGALISWAITADHYEQKLDAQRDLAVDLIRKSNKVRAELEESLDELRESVIELEEFDDSDVDMEVEEDIIPEGETEEETRSNLQRLIDKYTNDEDEVNRFVQNSYKEKVQNQNHKPPYIISQNSHAFDEDGEDFGKITLTYFPRERLLLDDEEDPIEDVQGTVGWRALSSFGDESGDGDTVFVRNERLKTDFEVVRDTENLPPTHVRYGMPKEEFETNKAAGLIRFRPEDL